MFVYFPGANIFLTSSGLIKLGDFGCSVKLKNNTQTMPGEVNSTLGTAGKRDSAKMFFCPITVYETQSVRGQCRVKFQWSSSDLTW